MQESARPWRLLGDTILYAPRQPPTLVRLLRIHTLREFSLLAFVAPCKPGRAQGRPKGQEGPRGQRDQRALWALWAKGPFGPLGEGAFGALGAHGAVGIIPNLFRMQVLSKGVKQRPAGSRVGRTWNSTPADDVEPFLEVAVAKI